MKLQIKRIGEATGLILPDELLTSLALQAGDHLVVTPLPDGSLKVSVGSPRRDEVKEIAENLFRDYRVTFQALAE